VPVDHQRNAGQSKMVVGRPTASGVALRHDVQPYRIHQGEILIGESGRYPEESRRAAGRDVA